MRHLISAAVLAFAILVPSARTAQAGSYYGNYFSGSSTTLNLAGWIWLSDPAAPTTNWVLATISIEGGTGTITAKGAITTKSTFTALGVDASGYSLSLVGMIPPASIGAFNLAKGTGSLSGASISSFDLSKGTGAVPAASIPLSTVTAYANAISSNIAVQVAAATTSLAGSSITVNASVFSGNGSNPQNRLDLLAFNLSLGTGAVPAASIPLSTVTAYANAISSNIAVQVAAATTSLAGSSITVNASVFSGNGSNPQNRLDLLAFNLSLGTGAVPIASVPLATMTAFANAVSSGAMHLIGAETVLGAKDIATISGTMTVVSNAFSVGGASFTVAGGSATVAYSLTVASLTATAKGAAVYSIDSSSGIKVGNKGLLDLSGASGIKWPDQSVTTSALSGAYSSGGGGTTYTENIVITTAIPNQTTTASTFVLIAGSSCPALTTGAKRVHFEVGGQVALDTVGKFAYMEIREDGVTVEGGTPLHIWDQTGTAGAYQTVAFTWNTVVARTAATHVYSLWWRVDAGATGTWYYANGNGGGTNMIACKEIP